jgi:diadenylate cyclase
MTDLLSDIIFLFERLTWLSVLDIFLVTSIFFTVLIVIKDTQAITLLRGVILLIIVLGFLSSLALLPAFSWLLKTTLPALLFAIPVIFAPEIRRALEKLGRAGSGPFIKINAPYAAEMHEAIKSVVTASGRLSSRQHGALIILQRADSLRDYIKTGVRMESRVTPELILQIFYPNTPLHDGAVIISDMRIAAASCVLPLSASGILNRSPERQMGLRHRAALGISEASDAIAVVVSEETGSISIAHNGRMIRRLDAERLENILLAFYRSPSTPAASFGILGRLFHPPSRKPGRER